MKIKAENIRRIPYCRGQQNGADKNVGTTKREFTRQEKEAARMLKDILNLGDNEIYRNDGVLYFVPFDDRLSGNPFPSIKEGERFTLNEIIGEEG